MAEPTLSEQLAAFAVATASSGAPRDVCDSMRQRLTDIIGLELAALDLGTSQGALDFVIDQGGSEQAHLTGRRQAVPATWAAFGNGVLAHSLDYDDTHLPSVLHPSASVVPAGLAVAEMVGVDGSSLLDALAVGVETVVRLGMAGYDSQTSNSVFFEHGQHATSICGALGAAVTAAMLLGLDEPRIVDTIGVAASMAGGVIEGNRTGGTVKRMHCGWAAHAGVSAALLARRGFTGPPTVLEGRFGFFEAFLHGQADANQITDGLGTVWSVPEIFFKPYPANHFTHAGLDAARRLRSRGLGAADVESAVLGVPGPVVRTIGEPLTAKQRPETGYQAQFSGPYTVAVGLFGGTGLGAGLEDFTDVLARDPARRDLMARITVEADAECDTIFPYQFPAVLRVRTTSGDLVEERVLVNRGGPGDPLSDDDVATKFRNNAARALPDEVVDDLDSRLRTVASCPDVRHISAVLASAGDSPPSKGEPAHD